MKGALKFILELPSNIVLGHVVLPTSEILIRLSFANISRVFFFFLFFFFLFCFFFIIFYNYFISILFYFIITVMIVVSRTILHLYTVFPFSGYIRPSIHGNRFGPINDVMQLKNCPCFIFRWKLF